MTSHSKPPTETRATTIVDELARRGEELTDRPAMRRRAGDRWEVITWAEYATGSRQIAAGLAELGVAPGERVAILSTNRVDWHLADHGTLANGSVTVPLYPTSSPEQVAYLLGHSESRVCFVENAEQAAKVLRVRPELPQLDHIVYFDNGDALADDPDGLTFHDLSDVGRRRLMAEPDVVIGRSGALEPSDVATLVYTSGTTGPPKGAVITHGNIMWTLEHATTPFDVRPGERLLSFLPLSHIAERMMSNFLPIAIGGETWFARSLATLAEDLRACRPTVFFAVPRVWEKLQAAIVEKLHEQPRVKRRLIDLYVRLGHASVASEQAGRRPNVGARSLYRALDRAAGGKIRSQLGLDQTHVLITAAAPIHPDLIRWFHAIGLPVVELYGQTEDCGPTTTNPPERNKIGTVGPPIPGVSVQVAEDNEILVKGGNVCAGYFKDALATAELIDAEGWMHTGDLGQLDPDGYLRITGRKKDLIINAAGKNISPQEIETDLANHRLVAQAVVIGDGRRYLTALVTLDGEELAAWAQEHQKPFDAEALATDPDLVAEIDAAISQANARRSRVESIRKFRVVPQDFTVNGGELTPTLKVKRNVVHHNYSALIDEMYADDGGQ